VSRNGLQILANGSASRQAVRHPTPLIVAKGPDASLILGTTRLSSARRGSEADLVGGDSRCFRVLPVTETDEPCHLSAEA
jgi:hypothetical protein